MNYSNKEKPHTVIPDSNDNVIKKSFDTFFEESNKLSKTMSEPQPPCPNASSCAHISSVATEDAYNKFFNDQIYNQFFNDQLGEDNTNPQVKLPTSKDMEDKNKEIEFLQNQIENLNLQMEDATSNYSNLQSKATTAYDNLTAQLNNLQLKLVIETSKLKDELDTCEKNRKHITDMFEQKDSVLTEAMKVVNQLRNKIIQYDTDKTNTEHLAKKCLQLTDELAKLKSDYKILKEIYEEAKKSAVQLPEEIIESNKLKEQLTAKDLQLISLRKLLYESEESLATYKLKWETVGKAYEENQKIITRLNRYILGKNFIIERLVNDLTDVTKAGIFSRRDVAVKALKDYEDFILNQNKTE